MERVSGEDYVEYVHKHILEPLGMEHASVGADYVRAFHNIIVNAYKHNPADSRVLVAVKKKNDKVVIIVADNGDVLTEKMLKTIFEPFVCGSESRNSRDGSGLGVAISKKIIEKHNGRLYVKEDILNYTKGFVIELEIYD